MTKEDPTFSTPPFVGASPEACQVKRGMEFHANSDKSVLIIGELGVGKEFAAKQIHQKSYDEWRPFVALNSAAFGYTIDRAEFLGRASCHDDEASHQKIGKLEQAANGALFLKDIDETPLDFQLLLFQILSEKKYRQVDDVDNLPFTARLFASTTVDLEKAVAAGRFRRDLYYLLKSGVIEIAPLRKRKQDLPAMMLHFLQFFCMEKGIEVPAVPAEIFEALLEHDWRGNVRELKDCVESLIMMSPRGELLVKYLPFKVKKHPYDFFELKNLNKVIADVEVYLIQKALSRFSGNQVKAAKLLGVPEATLRFKIRKYGILKN